MSGFERYPVKRTIYVQSIGRLLPRRIMQILRELDDSIKVWVNPKQGNNVDLKVWHVDSLLLVGEILHWSIGSLLGKKRREKMISNLDKYDCRRLLIYTMLDSKSLSIFEEANVDLLEIGYQIQPAYFYHFYALKNQIQKRKIDSKETKEHIRECLICYLNEHFTHISI